MTTPVDDTTCASCNALMVAAASSDGRCMSATSPRGVIHDTYRDESCHTLDCVMSHIEESRCAECNALMVAAASSDGRCMSATSPAGVRHDTYRDESRHTLDCVMSHIG